MNVYTRAIALVLPFVLLAIAVIRTNGATPSEAAMVAAGCLAFTVAFVWMFVDKP